MARVQLALNVADLAESVEFYTKLFGTEPAKRREGYAQFRVDSPPLKLVLIEHPGRGGSLNHLGVEVADSTEVASAQTRLDAAGVGTTTEDAVTCCHAVQDKVWVEDPDGAPWEIYTVLADVEDPVAQGPSAEVCGPCGCATELASQNVDVSA